MKKTLFLMALILFNSLSFSQAWMNNLPQGKTNEELTFFDYQNAFYQYWQPFHVDTGYYMENGIKKKALGWKQFKRWEYEMETKINPLTGEFPKRSGQEVYEEYLRDNPQSRSPLSASWTSLGPVSANSGYVNIGRVNCIAFHPSDNNTYWVGAASGGLWVTTNNGSSWTCLTDNNGVLAVSDIAIPSDYATSHVIYIATGDRDHHDNFSIGVLKSTDAGATWNTTGLSYPLTYTGLIYRLLMDPNNNQVLLASTSSGVYKTTNGGATWNTQLTSTAFIDMEYKPGDFNTLYGSTYSYSGGSKIYLSSNGGSTWTQIMNNASISRIELAVSANQPAWVYAVAANSSTFGLYGIFKSTNSGNTFTNIYDGNASCHNLLYYSDPCQSGGQAWYDLTIAASPLNANNIIVGGIISWVSADGGISWSMAGTTNAHVDKHMHNFRNDGTLFECNDGGVNLSTDNGTLWSSISGGLVISQMYKLGTSATVNNETITGLQDNGTKLLSGGTWSNKTGGDGMECLIDYTDVNTQYSSSQYGYLYRTTNHWGTNSTISPSGAGTGAWVTPYIIDPANNQTLYAGYSNVWKTTNKGDSWTQISTINATNYIRSMAIAPSNSQYLYVADYTHIWKTTNGGTTWTAVTGNLPVGTNWITGIAVKNDDPNTVWVTLGFWGTNNVYQSTAGGSTWTNISTGLPQLPAYSIVQNKQSTNEVQLYVGMEVGVYFKKGSDNWILFNTGLPNVKIGELEIYYASNPHDSKLRAATYGRGLWETPVEYTCTPLPVPTITGSASACTGATGVTYTTETGMTGYTWSVSSGGTITGGSGTSQITVTWTTAGAQTVSVNYYNSTGCTAASPTVKNVTVNPLPVPTITGSASVCAGATGVTYSTESAMTGYTWTVSSGGTITGGSGTPQITVTWGTTGAQTVSVNYTNSGGCSAAAPAVKNVTVNPLPVPTITGAATACAGVTGITYSSETGMTGYTWAVSSGGIITGGSGTSQVTITWNLPGAQTVSVNYTNSNSCTAASPTIKNVTVNPVPVPTISGLATVCEGTAGVTYTTETGMTGYTWAVSPGGTITGGSGTYQITVTWTTAGSQTVSVNYANSNSCAATSPTVKNVTVNSNPAAYAGPDQTIGYGASATLTGSASGGSGNYAWHWEPASLLVNPDVQNPVTVNLTSSASFTLTVTDQTSGCIGNDEVMVTVTGGILSVDATATPNPSCSGNAVQLLAIPSGGTGNYTYSWSSNPAGFSSTIYNPVAYPTVSTTYVVEINDGFAIATDSVLVLVTYIPAAPETPSGPDTVDLNYVSISDYHTIAVPSATSYAWELNPGTAGTIAGTGTTGTVTWNETFLGTARVRVSSANSCGESPWSPEKLTLVKNTTIGIAPSTSQMTFIIYPNPATDQLTVELSGYEAKANASLDFYEIQGKWIKRVPLRAEKTQIDISALPASVYLIKLTTGNEYRMLKFVKLQH
jgi:photosystem II stability/assembly factor-like uncharacterized protein